MSVYLNQFTIARRFIKKMIYGGNVIVLFLIIHFTNDRIQWVLKRWARLTLFPFITDKTDILLLHVTSLKAAIFIVAMIVLCLPIATDILKKLQTVKTLNIVRIIFIAFSLALILYFLIFRPGTDSMGTNYALIAQNPFGQASSMQNKRFLMPAIAHILLLRDFSLYYFFSVLLTVIFIALLLAYLYKYANLSTWQILSVCTSSFVLFQYQFGGYPDILLFILYLLVMQEYTGNNSKLCLLILAILTHEASIFIGTLLAWRYLDRKRFAFYIISIILYVLIWFCAARANVDIMLRGHNVNGMSGTEWLAKAPLNEMIGLLVSYKALWFILIAALWIAFRRRLFSDLLFISGCIFTGIGMTILGIDTSRLMGFSFPGLLIALVVVSKWPNQKITTTILALNLFLPSFYIGLNGGISFFPGLYKTIFGWLSTFMP